MPCGLLCLLSELGLPGHFCDTGVTSGDGDLRANLQDTMAFGKWKPLLINQIALFKQNFTIKANSGFFFFFACVLYFYFFLWDGPLFELPLLAPAGALDPQRWWCDPATELKAQGTSRKGQASVMDESIVSWRIWHFNFTIQWNTHMYLLLGFSVSPVFSILWLCHIFLFL